RDAAVPNRPIIGIADLGNAILGLSQRDDALGWSAASLARRFESSSTQERRSLARHLVAVLRAEVERIYADDLGIDGMDMRTSVRHLAAIARSADLERRADLREAAGERTPEYYLIREAHELVNDGRSDEVVWVSVGTTKLYR